MRGGPLGNHVQELINEGHGTERPISQDWPDLPPFIISEAPKNMRQLHPQAYEPRLVSIGPVHHSDERLLPMIQDKLRFYLRLSEQLYGSRDIDNEIKRKADNLAHKAKSCYPHTYGMTDSDFGLMLALDACFILELFRYAKQGIVVDDPIFRARWMLPAIRLDLIKFGNQLPFFVLEALYDLTSSGNESQPPLTKLAANFLAPLVPNAHEWSLPFDKKPTHLLAFIHSTFSPMSHNCSVAISDINLPWDGRCLVKSTNELQNYGIRLKKGYYGLLNINFDPSTAVLEIPSLVINHDTVSIFEIW
ncbi:unnamed protein product [Ilex paraguariensis]|uniref:Uncharacterized protein n=1 Tax=Ilex paraguariensis TaxID=185542 RepID=A0ABC8UX91_9AQUA